MNVRAVVREALRSGTIAGVAMIPFAAVFRSFGLRVNEYGPKTLQLLVADAPAPFQSLLILIQHIVISWFAAVPLVVGLSGTSDRPIRVLVGALYGAAFYIVVNSLALPFAFGDATPWSLGLVTVYPSLIVHVVFGVAVALGARPSR